MSGLFDLGHSPVGGELRAEVVHRTQQAHIHFVRPHPIEPATDRGFGPVIEGFHKEAPFVVESACPRMPPFYHFRCGCATPNFGFGFWILDWTIWLVHNEVWTGC